QFYTHVLQEGSMDYQLPNLRRSLAKLADPGVAENSLDRILLRITGPSVDLNCLYSGAHGELRAVKLCNRGLLAERLLVLRQPRRMKHQMLACFDLSSDIGELELDSLKACNGLSELLAKSRIAKRLLERTFGESQ